MEAGRLRARTSTKTANASARRSTLDLREVDIDNLFADVRDALATLEANLPPMSFTFFAGLPSA